jgi:hypothetical protein
MFITKSLSFLLLLSNNIRNYLSNENDSFYNKNRNSGTDERYDNNNENNNENEYANIYTLYKIKRYMINKNIIEELEKNYTNIHKLDIIEKYTDIIKNQNTVVELNLLAGNLLENFYDL